MRPSSNAKENLDNVQNTAIADQESARAVTWPIGSSVLAKEHIERNLLESGGTFFQGLVYSCLVGVDRRGNGQGVRGP